MLDRLGEPFAKSSYPIPNPVWVLFRAHGFSFQVQQKQEQQGSGIVESREQLMYQIRAALAPKVTGGE